MNFLSDTFFIYNVYLLCHVFGLTLSTQNINLTTILSIVAVTPEVTPIWYLSLWSDIPPSVDC